MTLALEILAWAKDKPDLSEIHYENKTGSAPIDIKITFDANKASAAVNGQRLTYVYSPAIGQLSLTPSKTQTGQRLNAGEIIGEINNGTTPVSITAPIAGKIIQTIAVHGSAVGYGETILILETAEAGRP